MDAVVAFALPRWPGPLHCGIQTAPQSAIDHIRPVHDHRHVFGGLMQQQSHRGIVHDVVQPHRHAMPAHGGRTVQHEFAGLVDEVVIQSERCHAYERPPMRGAEQILRQHVDATIHATEQVHLRLHLRRHRLAHLLILGTFRRCITPLGSRAAPMERPRAPVRRLRRGMWLYGG